MTDAELIKQIRAVMAELDKPGCNSFHDGLVALARIRALLGWKAAD